MTKDREGNYCYVCGKPLPSKYYLVSGNKSTDRVFLVDEICIDEVDKDYYKTKVKED